MVTKTFKFEKLQSIIYKKSLNKKSKKNLDEAMLKIL